MLDNQQYAKSFNVPRTAVKVSVAIVSCFNLPKELTVRKLELKSVG